MANLYDEISLSYLEKHKMKTGLSKSYSCFHDGYVYGDEMQYTSLEFTERSSHEVSYKGMV